MEITLSTGKSERFQWNLNSVRLATTHAMEWNFEFQFRWNL